MQKLHRKTFLLFLLLAFLTILLGFATNVLSDDFDKWCVEHFGAGYKSWLFGLLIVGTLIALYFTTDLGKNLFSKNAADRTLSPEETQNNYATIRQYLLEKRYRPRLQQKLAGEQLFNLRVKPTAIGASAEKAATFVTLKGKKTGEEIRQIFEQSRRRLLVTGVPGSGKTSLLLHLAIELLETDHENLTAILNLATWKSDYPTFDDWLREILPAELGVTKRYAAEILQQGKLTLLLDGLDEVDEAHRASCIDAIKGYGGKKQKDFVISTRKDEYKALEKDAPVWAQIEVLPLTKAQLLAQLDHADRRDSPEAPDLKAALENDPLLLKVAKTPFYLNCLQLLFKGGSTLSEMNFKGETVEVRQAEIVERFTEQALAMRSPRGYKPEQVRHWLAFLASRMWFFDLKLNRQYRDYFELAHLQYGWYKLSKIHLVIGWITYILVITLFFSLVFGIFFGGVIAVLVKPKTGLLCGLIIGIAIALILSMVVLSKDKLPSIVTREGVLWSWRAFYLQIDKAYFIESFIAFLLFGLIAVPFFGVMYGALFGFFAWALLAALTTIIASKPLILQITSPYQRFTASAKALHFSILQHWLLCWQLYRAGVLPFRLVKFLNEMTERHFLETDGATWRFRHRILQEYFAGQWQEASQFESSLKTLKFAKQNFKK